VLLPVVKANQIHSCYGLTDYSDLCDYVFLDFQTAV